MSPVTVRPMRAGEEPAISTLVDRVFRHFVAPDFGPEGIQEFESYNRPEALAARAKAGEAVLVAEEEGRLDGMVELRGFRHISMLFVEGGGRGVGRRLVERAIALCREREPELRTITVHAARSAAPFYAHLGFRPLGPHRTEGGITYVPMALELEVAGLEGQSV